MLCSNRSERYLFGAAIAGATVAFGGAPLARAGSDVPVLPISPPDCSAALAAPAVSDGPAPVALGVDVLAGLEVGAWQGPAADGSESWRLELVAPGARAVRVKLAGFDLPAGAELRFVPTDPSRCRAYLGPFDGRGSYGDGVVWSPPVPGESIGLELRVAAGAKRPSGLYIDSIQYFFRDLALPADIDALRLSVRGATPPPPGGAAPCEQNAMCQLEGTTDLMNLADAVGLLLVPLPNNSVAACTGTLVRTLADDHSPLLLTADHCLANNTGLSGAAVVWFYRGRSCASAAPPATITSSNGMTSLWRSSATDQALLMVDGALPSGVAWAEWTSDAIPNQTLVCSLHHPAGDVLCWSEGHKESLPGCHPTDHFRSDWQTGTSENGSSGAGVFRESDLKLIGTVTCGPIAPLVCTFTSSSCGEFAVSYGSLGLDSMLVEGADDAQEPNDHCAQAVEIPVPAQSVFATTISNLVVKDGNRDWFAFTVPAYTSFSASVQSIPANGDIDVRLWSASCLFPTLVDVDTGQLSLQTVRVDNSTSGRAVSVLLEVYLLSDTRNNYSLIVSSQTSPPPNATCLTALPLTDGTTYGTTALASISPSVPSCSPAAGSARAAWYRYTAACTGLLSIDTCGSSFDTHLSVHTGNFCTAITPVTLACNDDAANGSNCHGDADDSDAIVSVTAGQSYILRIGAGGSGGQGAFKVAARCDPTPSNDTCAAAVVLAAFPPMASIAGTTRGATASVTTLPCTGGLPPDAWYSYRANCTGPVTFTVQGQSGFSPAIAVTKTCPTLGSPAPLACEIDADGDGRVAASVSADNLQLLLIRVAGTPHDSYGAWRGDFTLSVAQGCAITATGDFNGQNGLTVQDVFDFLAAFFAADERADFDRSGQLGPNDIFTFLAAWFGGV